VSRISQNVRNEGGHDYADDEFRERWLSYQLLLRMTGIHVFYSHAPAVSNEELAALDDFRNWLIREAA